MSLTVELNEEWRDVAGWDGRYSISNLGRLRTNYIDYANQTGGCWRRSISRIRTIPIHPKGYRYVNLSARGHRLMTSIHQLVARAFIPNPKEYTEINHLNGVKHDNRIENLEWVSRQGNMGHAWKQGLMANARLTGTKHHKAKLTDDDVRAIREAVPHFEDNEMKYQLADCYGISICTINDILQRRSWKHVA